MNSKRWSFDEKVVVYGSSGHIKQAIDVLDKFLSPKIRLLKNTPLTEGNIRTLLYHLINEHKMDNVDISYYGNTVWNEKKILSGIKRVLNGGMDKMTDYLYKFLSLACGSIAHYNKYGWIEEYPTVESLREFFRRNEFGQRVLNHIPLWYLDSKMIVEKIEVLLGI